MSTRDANLLYLDEPTNHLDLWARDSLEKTLNDYEGTVVIVSHDRYFLDQVCDMLLVVEPKRFRVIDGNYSTYQTLIDSGLAQEARVGKESKTTTAAVDDVPAESKAKRAKGANSKPRRKRKFPYRKVAELESEIAAIENRIEAIYSEMGLEATLRDGDLIKNLNAELESLQNSLEPLYEHLEEAIEMN